MSPVWLGVRIVNWETITERYVPLECIEIFTNMIVTLSSMLYDFPLIRWLMRNRAIVQQYLLEVYNSSHRGCARQPRPPPLPPHKLMIFLWPSSTRRESECCCVSAVHIHSNARCPDECTELSGNYLVIQSGMPASIHEATRVPGQTPISGLSEWSRINPRSYVDLHVIE